MTALVQLAVSHKLFRILVMRYRETYHTPPSRPLMREFFRQSRRTLQ